MLNPYSPPESDIRSGINLINPKRGWKIFFWSMLMLELMSLFSMMSDSDISQFDIYSDLIVYVFIFIGLYGYSHDKKIFTREFWGYLIPVGVSFDTYSIVSIGYREFENFYDLYYVFGIIIIVGLPLMFLQYFALFKYRFNSDNIWL